MLGTSRTFRPAAHAKNRRGIKQPSLRMQGDNYLDTHRNHASPRTTKLYDRRSDEISLDDVEKIAI